MLSDLSERSSSCSFILGGHNIVHIKLTQSKGLKEALVPPQPIGKNPGLVFASEA